MGLFDFLFGKKREAAPAPAAPRAAPAARITTLRVGESLVGDGNEVAHIDLILGPRGTPAEEAFANCLVNNKDGFTSLLSVVAPNLICKPNTVMFNKVTIKGAKQAVQMFGPAQRGVAMAVADSVAEGIIPKALVNELCIISLVWIDPRCAKDANLDKKDMYRTNYEATRLAIKRALNNEPSIEELIANRHKIKHDMDDWS